MKVRNLVGGAVIGALALGIWLGSFWKGPGLGGSGTGFGTSNSTGNGLESTQTNTSVVRAVPGSVNRTEALEKLPTDLMTVVIRGDQYELLSQEGDKNAILVSLNEIAERAKLMTGTPEGIRVRILKGKTAQEGTRADLIGVLAENGVKREEIQERAEFVD